MDAPSAIDRPEVADPAPPAEKVVEEAYHPSTTSPGEGGYTETKHQDSPSVDNKVFSNLSAQKREASGVTLKGRTRQQ